LTDKTLIDLSARLATSARLPAGLKLRPDGCFEAAPGKFENMGPAREESAWGGSAPASIQNVSMANS
jgi:hypothetical protein